MGIITLEIRLDPGKMPGIIAIEICLVIFAIVLFQGKNLPGIFIMWM